MAISDKTRSGALAQVLASERKTLNEQLRVAMPGIIQSFDPDAVTAVVQPAIRYIERVADRSGNIAEYVYYAATGFRFPDNIKK